MSSDETGEVPELALADFLLARIAEDETTVRLVTNGGKINAVGGVAAESAGDVYSATRMLAECEAKRRIVEDIRDNYLRYGDGAIASTDGLALRVLDALALPYRPKWRP